MRIFKYLFVVPAITCVPAGAQNAEPLLTKSAIPFVRGEGAIKLDYVRGIGQSGGNSQVIPESTLEAGVLSGLEVLVRFPLLLVRPVPGGPAVIGGGQLALGARYLLTGTGARSFAVSVQTIVEAPTGDTKLVGNSTQVISGVLADWRPISRLAIHSNMMFDHSVGGTGRTSSFFEYANAFAWSASRHVVLVFEIAGSADTITGRTQLVGLPEVIVPIGQHLELKAGLSPGLNSETHQLALRTQVAWHWGKRN